MCIINILTIEKKAYIIIPSTDIWLHENKSYDSIKEIITQLRISDKNIEQKIYVSNLEYIGYESVDLEKTNNNSILIYVIIKQN